MRTKLSNRWSGGVTIWALLLFSVSTGCEKSTKVDGLASLNGRLLFGREVVCVPDHRWRSDSTTGVWSFRGFATIACYVSEEARDSITFFFQMDADTADGPMAFQWDGLNAGELRPSPRQGNQEIRVPPEKLMVGRHVLKIGQRVPGEETNRIRLQTFGYRMGEVSEIFDKGKIESYQYLSDFLHRRKTGLSKVKREGFVFSGPGRVQVELQNKNTETLIVYGENASSQPARFVIGAGGQDQSIPIEPFSGREIQVPLTGGTTKLELGVEGTPSGHFLWGAPFLTQAEPLTPIVLLTLDTTRRDALSPYGGSSELTPHLERFAETSTVYENAYSTSPWTLPSHASIFSGYYPSRHHLGVVGDQWAPGLSTLAERLSARGYFTAGFAGGELISYRFGISRGFLLYRNPDDFETLGDRLTDYLEDFLAEHHNNPFFLFANYFDPHGLYRAPPRFEALTGVQERKPLLKDVPIWRDFVRGSHEAWQDIIFGKAPIVPESLAYFRAVYLAEVAFMDSQFGRFIEALERWDLYDRSLIIVVADHGEALGERGYFTHSRRLDPEIVEIPLIIKWPGRNRGEREVELVSLTDLFSTILHAAGATYTTTDGMVLTRTGPETRGERPFLMMEEHVCFVHPPDPMFIAPHL